LLQINVDAGLKKAAVIPLVKINNDVYVASDDRVMHVVSSCELHKEFSGSIKWGNFSS
jgi:hypothetical protein